MTMNVEILQAHLEADDIAREAIEEVDRAAQRAADLVRQLLAFSRRQTIQLAALNLNDRIEDALKLIRRVLGEHIELRFSPGGALQSTLADKGQVEQILMNLCVNARDAMPEGGALSIETGNAVFDRVFLCDNPWAAEGQYVFVRVSDTGHGMDTETLEHIFDPFFTTKEIGKGTGLGLASVYGIVKQHKGFIRVTSTPDRGTSFWVFFPVADAVPAKDSAAPKRFASGGRETILLAEDEPMLLGLLSRILSAAGYTVLTACDGQEALRIFENNADAIHLVMCDVVMPGMNGRAVMERIKARRPDVSFVFSSGYSAEAIQSDFVLDKGLRFIQKPYRHGDLLRIVRETLDTAERNPD